MPSVALITALSLSAKSLRKYLLGAQPSRQIFKSEQFRKLRIAQTYVFPTRYCATET